MSTSEEKQNLIRIGVDLGGTKIEFVALERDGRELHRHRMATPRFDYEGTVRAITDAVTEIEKEIGSSASVGLGIPGTISTKTGLVKNANSTWMNGKPFDKDLRRGCGQARRFCGHSGHWMRRRNCGRWPRAQRLEWSCGRMGAQHVAVDAAGRVSRSRVLLREERLHRNVDIRNGPGSGL